MKINDGFGFPTLKDVEEFGVAWWSSDQTESGAVVCVTLDSVVTSPGPAFWRRGYQTPRVFVR